jgi:PPOX class probable FMN-dependent enzyme
VLDDTTIALPDRPGNRRVDGYKNILENPHVGINFLIPGRGDTLRINGSARLVTGAAWFTELAVEARPPALALVVTVEEVFMHCAKALLRARLWDPDSWDPEGIVPRPAVIAKHTHRPDETLEALDAHYARNYGGVLY